MDRTSAKAWLVEKFRELSVYAEFTSTQIDSAYAWTTDMSLRQLKVAEADLQTADVADADVLKFLALLNYYALDRFATLASPQFDAKVGGGAADAKLSQVFDMVQKLKAQASAELAQYGLIIGGSASFETGSYNLDFLEPSMTSEF